MGKLTNHEDAEIIHCQNKVCQEVMVKKEDPEGTPFWECPICGSEWWPKLSRRLEELERKKRQQETEEEKREQIASMVGSVLYPDPLPPGDPVFKGGGKSGKKSRDPKKDKVKRRPSEGWKLE